MTGDYTTAASRRSAARLGPYGLWGLWAYGAIALTASRTAATWPFTLTFGQCWTTLPSLPISTVERMIPFIFLPYITLSPHAP